MQIQKIAFKNINNLKGEHSIDFSSTPLRDAGMFAIVGPTGSGKSTLLDVITLALFNKIPRFKKALTKSEMQGSGSVITRHTNDAFASVDYIIKNQLYTSKWEVSKTRTGNLKDYHMDIYSHASGSYLDLKKSEVPSRNMRIIGLDYDQFIKSIILSQGQFAKFLKADKNERGLLLENITGSKIYRTIGVKAFEKNKAIKEQIERHKERQEDIITLSVEERNSITELLAQSEETLKAANIKIKALTELKQVKSELQTNQANLNKQEHSYKVLLERIRDFKRQEQRLSIHEKASPHLENLGIYNMSVYQLNLLGGQLSEYQSKIDNAKKHLANVVNEMAELTQETVNEGNFHTVMQAFESKVNNLDNELKNIKANGAEIRQQVNTAVSSSKSKTADLLSATIKPKEATHVISTQMSTLSTIIKQNGFNLEDDILSINKDIEKDKELLSGLKVLAEKYLAHNDKKSKLETVKKQLSEHLKNLETHTATSKKLTQTITELKKLKEKLDKQRAEAIKLFDLADHRKELVSGDPCPLCGSPEHPYGNHIEDKRDGYEIEINKTSALINKQEDQLKQKEAQIAESKVGQQTCQQQQEALTLELKSDKETLDQLSNTYKIDLANPTQLSTSIEGTTKQITQKDLVLQSIVEYKEIEALQRDYKKLETIARQYVDISNKRQQLFKGPSISAVCNDLQNKYTDCTTIIVTNQQSITENQKKRKNDQKILDIVTKKLGPVATQLGAKNITELKSLILQDGEVSNIKTKKEQLATQKTKLETEIKTLAESIASLIKKDTKGLSQLEQISLDLAQQEKAKEELITNMGALNEQIKQDDANKKRAQTFQKELDQLRTEQEKWALLNKIIGDATGNKFANFAQGLTLQNLIVLANKRLNKLSERYLLCKPEDEGLLQVIDVYQGSTKRAVNTLSGGESFMVSLALALSLSDMASKNVALDSLFIDEGFGTLDPATLETAMDTLEKLQTESQKTVGVISHVEALKERISVQIQLKKNAQGYSKIEVVS